MALLTKVFSATVPATSSTIDLTDSGVFGGETPKALMVMVTRTGTADNTEDRLIWGFGVSTAGSVSRSVGVTSSDNQPISRAYSATSLRTYVRVDLTTGTIQSEGTVEPITNGVRITPLVYAASIQLSILAIGGSDVVDADVFDRTYVNGSTTLTTTFRPDVLVAFSTDDAEIFSPAPGASISVGVASRGDDSQGCASYASQHNVTTSRVVGQQDEDTLLKVLQSSANGNYALRQEITSWEDDGVELTSVCTSDPDKRIFYLALQLRRSDNGYCSASGIGSSNRTFSGPAGKTPAAFVAFCGHGGYLDDPDTSTFPGGISGWFYESNGGVGSFTSRDNDNAGTTNSRSRYSLTNHEMIFNGTGVLTGTLSFSGADTVWTYSSGSSPSNGTRIISLTIADNPALNAYLGSTEITKGYLGTTEITDAILGTGS